MKHKDYSKIPASACTLVVGGFELGDNGEDAKSAPIKLTARSGKPIEHPFWGRIVHDLDGMKLHKNRLPIDYVHDAKEIIGYLNHFDSKSGDLVASGALVPWKDNDRATEIMHKLAAGVPYEASINFGGDGIKIEDVPDGFVTSVNGYELEGPAVVVREWPLRGVAVCPYGADMNTESIAFSDGNEYAATVITTEPKTTTEESEMSDKPVEVAEAVESAEAAELEQEQTEETVEAETTEATEEAVEVEEQEVTEDEEQPEAEPQPEPVAELSREEFTRIADRFGNDIAVQIVREGGDYAKAMELHVAKLEEQNKELSAKVSELSEKQKTGGVPVKITEKKQPASLFKSGK